jgi:hypothetical protein
MWGLPHGSDAGGSPEDVALRREERRDRVALAS